MKENAQQGVWSGAKASFRDRAAEVEWGGAETMREKAAGGGVPFREANIVAIVTRVETDNAAVRHMGDKRFWNEPF